eukprot:ANDGO_01555.mRNA.1 transporter
MAASAVEDWVQDSKSWASSIADGEQQSQDGGENARTVQYVNLPTASLPVTLCKLRMMVGLVWISYFVAYLGRVSVVILLSELVRDSSANMSTALVGSFLAVGSFAALGGKLSLCLAIDRIGGTKSLHISLLLSAVFLVVFAVSASPLLFFFSWSGFRYFSTPLWPASLRILKLCSAAEDIPKWTGLIFTAPRIGALAAAFFVGALLLMETSWRLAVFLCAVLHVACSLLAFCLFPSTLQPMGNGAAPEPDLEDAQELDNSCKDQAGGKSPDQQQLRIVGAGHVTTPTNPPPTTILEALKFYSKSQTFWVVSATNFAFCAVVEMESFVL